jgi:DNA-binding CsgD family transcriptional regulator
VNRVSDPSESVVSFGELQRFLAVCADAASCTRVDLGAIWQELNGGQYVIADHFFIHDRCFAALRSLRPSVQPESRVVTKEGFAQERSFPVWNADTALLKLSAGASEVPLLLVMAHHAFCHGDIEAHLSEIVHEGVAFRIIGVDRPDTALSDTLSAAEREVTRLSIEGRSLREIAARSQISEHDTINRLAAAFEKLGVKSRLELMQKVVQDQWRKSRSSGLAP